MAKRTAIGIDLGTTYSCVGYWKNDRVEIIANEQGNRITPSYVAFTDNETLAGEAAYNQAAFYPIDTVFDAKRLIGRGYSDETVQNDLKLWPFKVICGTDNKPMISVTYKGEKKEFSAEEISSLVLTKMKQIAESFIGSEVKDAVITVPAYFGQSQRVATIEAGKLAGINVLRIINEPTAAAIAYGLDFYSRVTGKSRNVLIFDLGGGTFDVSLLTTKEDKIEVKAVGGDTHLGGQDFDNRVVEYFTKEIKRKHGKDITENPRAIRRLRTACERGKRLLSCATETFIEVFFEGIEFSSVLTRSKFEELNIDLFYRCIETVERTLTDAKIETKDVDDVVLVGGSSRILKIQQMVRELLNRKELCRSINPDEAVAYGAAVQAAILSGQASDKIINLVLTEVTPLSIGFGRGHVGEGVMTVAIPRNSTIPTTKTTFHVTGSDNQSNVVFDIYEGERARCKDNKLLGVIKLTDIQVGPRGVPCFELCHHLQADGILNVTAKDQQTGQQKSITVASGRSSGQEIETMMKDAEMHKEEDEKVKEKNEARRALFHYACEKRDAVNSNRDIAYDVKKKVEDAIGKAFQWMDVKKEQLVEVAEYEEQKKLLMNLF